MRLLLTLLILLPWLIVPAYAADQSTASPTTRATPSDLSMKTSAQIAPAPLRSARFALKSQFSAKASVGELRESNRFTLIGRLAKAGESCDFTAIFANGFEAN